MEWPIYLYIPNLIGYGRIISSTIAFHYAFHDKKLFVIFYFFSFLCDYLDGKFAVLFNQKSTFGAVLDMVTDRMSTAGLLLVLSIFYTKYFNYFLFLLVLDISSHWMQMYSSFLCNKQSHKEIKEDDFFLMKIYYQNRYFMGYCCIAAEIFYLCFYLLQGEKFESFDTFMLSGNLFIFKILSIFAFPGFFLKQIINLVQIKQSSDICVNYDMEKKKN